MLTFFSVEFCFGVEIEFWLVLNFFEKCFKLYLILRVDESFPYLNVFINHYPTTYQTYPISICDI